MSSDLALASETLAVSVNNVSKHYSIYGSPRDRLKQFVLPRISRMVGREAQRYYRDFTALESVSFNVQKGETFGIVGKNGSGKSTLLQIICGTLAPSTGTVNARGRVAALLELGAGFNPEFTGRENVYLNGTVLGLSQEQIDERFDRIAAFADIGEFIDQPVKTYSSGMYVRLAFAVIANVDADILVVDEALAVGDTYFVQKCMRFLHEFMEHGTLLFVSHDTSTVQRLCSRAMLLNQGTVELISSPKEVGQRYLANLYSEYQDIDGAEEESNKADWTDPTSKLDSGELIDMREQFPSRGPARCDIEIFRFKPDSDSFGTGLVDVQAVQLRNANDQMLQWIVGGEFVRLRIAARALADLTMPIVGFELKDRLGQAIFGENTYLWTLQQPVAVGVGREFEAIFEFRMPSMPPGDYSFAVAVAEGTQESHVQHQWIHDALIIRIHNESVCFGIVGVPMQRIQLRVSGS